MHVNSELSVVTSSWGETYSYILVLHKINGAEHDYTNIFPSLIKLATPQRGLHIRCGNQIKAAVCYYPTLFKTVGKF